MGTLGDARFAFFAPAKMVEDTEFRIAPALASSTHKIPISLPLCEVLLNDDSTWPWVILVPKVPGVEEIHDLSVSDQQQLMKEIAMCSAAIDRWYDVDKINVGALGCVCRQLHVHVLGQNVGDIVWPKPVWGATEPVRYEAGAADAAVRKMKESIVRSGGLG